VRANIADLQVHITESAADMRIIGGFQIIGLPFIYLNFVWFWKGWPGRFARRPAVQRL
jgi:hypothetical protein